MLAQFVLYIQNYRRRRMKLQWASIKDWVENYTQGAKPEDLLTELLSDFDAQDTAWITLATPLLLKKQLEVLKTLPAGGPGQPSTPLWGVPFAVKDNIDVAGWPTTAACPAFSHRPTKTASVVESLQKAGAILVGKTNMDQFATGLVGTRSPYGPVPNSFNPQYISGGSSSGSAVVVARGLVPFSLGTDTAGSGRIPAAFGNIVGLKPTRGAISTWGVLPACRSLDCVSIFALSTHEARLIYSLTESPDSRDPYNRTRPKEFSPFPQQPSEIRLGYPAQLRPECDDETQNLFKESLKKWANLGFSLVPVDFSPLHELAALLYQGPWVAERYVAIKDFFDSHNKKMDPIVAGILGQGKQWSAADFFQAEYRRKEILQTLLPLWLRVNALLMPTAPSIFTLLEVSQEPLQRNSDLGVYTNFMNLADLCALAIPGGFRQNGLPQGLTLAAPAWQEEILWNLGEIGKNLSPGEPGNQSVKW